MHRKFVWLTIAASLACPACGDTGGSVDKSVDGADDALASDVGLDGYPVEGDVQLPGDLTYPTCRSASLKRTFFACTSSGRCVADCSDCAPTPIDCVSPGTGPCGGVTDTERKCVADCSACSFSADDGSIVLTMGTDVCTNTCTSTQSDSCNCGACGNAYPTSAPNGTHCDQGHFCPPLPDDSPTVFVPDCLGDGGDAGRCCLTQGSCVAFPDTQCIAPL